MNQLIPSPEQDSSTPQPPGKQGMETQYGGLFSPVVFPLHHLPPARQLLRGMERDGTSPCMAVLPTLSPAQPFSSLSAPVTPSLLFGLLFQPVNRISWAAEFRDSRLLLSWLVGHSFPHTSIILIPLKAEVTPTVILGGSWLLS